MSTDDPTVTRAISDLAREIVIAIECDLIGEDCDLIRDVDRPSASTVSFTDACTAERWEVVIRRAETGPEPSSLGGKAGETA